EARVAGLDLACRRDAGRLPVGHDARRPAGLAVVLVTGEVDLAPIAGIAVAIAETHRAVADAALAVLAPGCAVLAVAGLSAAAAIEGVLGDVRFAPIVAAVAIGKAVGAGDLAHRIGAIRCPVERGAHPAAPRAILFVGAGVRFATVLGV